MEYESGHIDIKNQTTFASMRILIADSLTRTGLWYVTRRSKHLLELGTGPVYFCVLLGHRPLNYFTKP